ncbi:hypothetical protein TREES_T100007432 [Tupaia chinensis]|uniref:Ubiquitin-ribosomal protein eL40 fusion protein n=1 Tax=Tupaia chinensis TaxID=246437 RepID=L9KZ80_TUPCH|nr:hypothetical protein TREES_T100007432 [Tupaia chinensis]
MLCRRTLPLRAGQERTESVYTICVSGALLPQPLLAQDGCCRRQAQLRQDDLPQVLRALHPRNVNLRKKCGHTNNLRPKKKVLCLLCLFFAVGRKCRWRKSGRAELWQEERCCYGSR